MFLRSKKVIVLQTFGGNLFTCGKENVKLCSFQIQYIMASVLSLGRHRNSLEHGSQEIYCFSKEILNVRRTDTLFGIPRETTRKTGHITYRTLRKFLVKIQKQKKRITVIKDNTARRLHNSFKLTVVFLIRTCSAIMYT